jgi:hypothetical protein
MVYILYSKLQCSILQVKEEANDKINNINVDSTSQDKVERKKYKKVTDEHIFYLT